jgi:hypothetical protein
MAYTLIRSKGHVSEDMQHFNYMNSTCEHNSI